MPLYDYCCEKCDANHEVIKPMSEHKRQEPCPACGNVMQRLYSTQVQFMNTKVKDAEYYHAFGKVIKNDYHRSEEMKRRNVIEIGSEKPDRVREHTERYRKAKLSRDYED